MVVSERDRSASTEFWSAILDPLARFLERAPDLVARDLGGSLPSPSREAGAPCIFQVQWLTGRKANYWHQDVRWKTHWDAVLFLYVGARPTPTEICCPDAPVATHKEPKEYVRCPDGHPQIAAWTAAGQLETHRPALGCGDVVVIDNRRVWHRTAPAVANRADDATSDDALMTIRLKALAPRPAS